ncbi:MAG TPA: tetratricopeptide repeat protein [Thermoanaerobaculia bacterium]|jgi:tetratricopeptide (TPR) repeat protein
MAQPATNAKIEELRYRLKTDPKSRLFFPLAEELRKAGALDESEAVLRTGLSAHPTYLSAWVSLGRVLRDQKKDGDALEPLNKALQLDPGNVVAARLLADAYYALGEKVEAIKKYKLVHALLPTDQDVVAMIHRLDQELAPPPPPIELEPEPEAEAELELQPEPQPQAESQPDVELPAQTVEEPFSFDEQPSTFAAAEQAIDREQSVEIAAADDEPMSVAHDASPFEEPVETYSSAALAIEAPSGFHVERAPLVADVPTPVAEELLPTVESAPISPEPTISADEADIFAPPDEQSAATNEPPAMTDDPFASEEPFATEEPFVAEPQQEDLTNTLTMADLYARQGAISEARQIYDNILARDPDNHDVRARLEALLAPPATTETGNRAKIARLENWLARVSRKEAGRV